MNTETDRTDDRYTDISKQVDRETAEKLNPYIDSQRTVDTLNQVCLSLDKLGNLSVVDEAGESGLDTWYWTFEAMSAALRYEGDALRSGKGEEAAP